MKRAAWRRWPIGLQSFWTRFSIPAGAALIVVLGSVATAEDLAQAPSSQLDASRLPYARLYCTADNESHFGGLAIDLAKQDFAPPAAPIFIGGNRPASSVLFAGFEAGWGAPTSRTASIIRLRPFSCSPSSMGNSRSQRRTERPDDCTPAMWSSSRTWRLAKGISRWWATQPDSCFSRARSAAARARLAAGAGSTPFSALRRRALRRSKPSCQARASVWGRSGRRAEGSC
jgi:hypothetical protein